MSFLFISFERTHDSVLLFFDIIKVHLEVKQIFFITVSRAKFNTEYIWDYCNPYADEILNVEQMQATKCGKGQRMSKRNV